MEHIYTTSKDGAQTTVAGGGGIQLRDPPSEPVGSDRALGAHSVRKVLHLLYSTGAFSAQPRRLRLPVVP